MGSVGTMKWTRGQLSWLLLLSQGFLTTGQRQTTLGASLQPPSPASKCSYECVKVYSLHNSNEFDQTNYALDACVKGCDIFSRIEFDRGTHEPLDNLKNCNFSCDDIYEGSLLPACQSGCGFHFDNDVTQPPQQPPAPSFRPRSDAPIPIFTRPMGVSQQPLSSLAPTQRSEAPMIPFRGQNPFFNVFRSQPGPIIVRKRKVKTLFIKGEKPSTAVMKAAEVAAKAKAKEAEANGFNPGEYMVAVINVDMPPNYLDVTPGSPAPSYKSDMASQVVPGSPAPSYRSVDGEAPKVALEPVHGKKESNA